MAEKIVNGNGFGEFRHHGGGKDRGFGGEKPTTETETETAEPSAAS
ncbi:hypothetical protein [Cohnella luojiensis]|nr:hypothetical protein [Cohnella luojiensis]